MLPMTDASFEILPRFHILFDDSLIWRRLGSEDRTAHRVVSVLPDLVREAYSVHVQRFEVVGRRRRMKPLGDGFSMDASRFVREFETLGEVTPGTPERAV